jgi:uncharacterized protein (DUF885 family)
VAKKAAEQNGHDRLDEAMALLIQNQAAFVGRLSENDRVHADLERQHLELKRESDELKRQSDERFARIEAQMEQIIRILAEHSRILERLPETIRDKIGFKAQE